MTTTKKLHPLNNPGLFTYPASNHLICVKYSSTQMGDTTIYIAIILLSFAFLVTPAVAQKYPTIVGEWHAENTLGGCGALWAMVTTYGEPTRRAKFKQVSSAQPGFFPEEDP